MYTFLWRYCLVQRIVERKLNVQRKYASCCYLAIEFATTLSFMMSHFLHKSVFDSQYQVAMCLPSTQIREIILYLVISLFIKTKIWNCVITI